jgi:type IV pilus assembly protein PilY1
MMSRILKTTIKVLQGSALSGIVFFSSAMPANAATLSMANTPLFLGAAVQPNVFFVSDDSGSMDWEFMTPAYWRWFNYDPDPIRNGTFSNGNTSSRYTRGTFSSADFSGTNNDDGGYGYIYNNSDNVYGNTTDGSGCTSNYFYGRVEKCDDSNFNPFDVDWRGRSFALNKVFFNPNIDYQPWDGPCDTAGNPCADASFTAARSDPYSTQTGYSKIRNLATDGDGDDGPFIYEVWIDDSGYNVADGYPKRGSRFNETGHASTAFSPVIAAGVITSDVANEEIDLWDSHLKFTVTNAEINVQLVEYNPAPATVGATTRGLNETVRVDTDISNPACYNVLGSAAMVKNIRDQMLIDPANAASYITAANAEGCRTIVETRQNAANWYQYYRRRAFPVKNAIAEVIDAQPNFRFGMTVLNKYNTLFTPVPDVSVTNYSSHNTSIKQKYFAFDQPAVGTPLRNALYRAGQYYDDTLSSPSTDDPILYSCQKNFTVLFTDGYWNSSFSYSGVNNSDGDGESNTVADIAHHFYMDVDLSPLEDNVKPDLPLESDLPVTKLNPTESDEETTHQHMVTFTVAFGVTGNLSDSDVDGMPDLDAADNAWPGGVATKDGNWGDAFDSDQEKIDDLWHAAYNSAGVYASASTPTEVSERLIEAISAIAARVGSASAVALNSGTLNANSRLYQARFNSNGGSGDLFSRPLQDGAVDKTGPAGVPDGVDDSPSVCNAYPTVGALCDVEWSAAAKLATMVYTTRKIFTLEDDTYTAVAFKDLSDLGANQQAALKTDPDTANVGADSDGQDRIDYLRGDHSKEADQSGGSFRIRLEVMDYENTAGIGEKSVLGDIISSAPAYVGAPNFFYPNTIEADKYTEYKLAQRDREGVVYVGANDGMLHAFDGATGAEKFAYQPGAIIEKMNLLTSVRYNSGHNYFVDGSPTVFDAYDGGWNTMLASSSGAGAQLVFGLNITDPDATNLLTALSPWEFTDDPRSDAGGTYGDVDLGYTIGNVSFGKMNNGEWAVIFGSGYNNTFADGNVSTTGNGAIYVVNAFTGALIKKFNTQVGMSEDPTSGNRPNGVATVTPVDTDGDFKVDYLYAGDLFGNTWKVDVKNSNETNWKFAYESAGKPAPFFVAKDVNDVEQPITSALTIKRHPIERDQTLVLFGTGKYFEVGDSASAGAATQIQSFYGIWDNNILAEIKPARSKLLKQEIKSLETVTGVDGILREFRVTSSEKEDLVYKIDWATDRGWYIDLRFGAEYGERVVVNPLIRNNRIIFVTQTPDEDPCSAGGSSWIMEINANDGNRLDVPPFDVNGDGIIDDNDVVNYLGKDTITSGVRSKQGIVAQPGILNNNKGDASEFKYFSGTKGGIDVVTESANAEFRKRQSWRQLR